MLRSPLINVMTAAAQKAGRALVRDFGEVEHLQVSRKGPADFVTKADRKSEKILFEELQKARPKYGLLMEESGEIEGADTSNRWIVDPLDGTTNFLHAIPHWAVSIGLERDGQIFAGVIYNPVTDDMFVAEKGQGAYLNGRRLRVSARREMKESVFSTGIPFQGKKDHEAFLAQLRAVMAVSAGIRRYGAAALDLAWLAAGRYEGFWEESLQPWDMAAGLVLVAEAGGFVTDMAGGKDMFAQGDIVAGSPTLHPALLDIVKNAATSA
ncbi:MAG: inositol monophosphatase family protein [Rhodospirillaceae bacterium]